LKKNNAALLRIRRRKLIIRYAAVIYCFLEESSRLRTLDGIVNAEGGAAQIVEQQVDGETIGLSATDA
jgi:hypothetical protein